MRAPSANRAATSGCTAPPEWSNAVYLRNYCLRRWYLVWSHQYVGPQTDCSQIFGVGGWWGPILETFPSGDGEPFPQTSQSFA